jgi:NAD(P)-dependent dehydrogenase (short-subunit alcohol dehydrogenase family)
MNQQKIYKPCLGRAFLFLALLIASLPVPVIAANNQNADNPPTVLITGSNRGIGLEFTKQYAAANWRVIATCRHPATATDLKALMIENSNITIEALDVTDAKQITALADKYRSKPIDVLINNAALLGDPQTQLLGQIDYTQFEQILAVNVMGPLRVSEAFLDHVAASDEKKIVVLGSAAGSNGLLGPVPNLYAYRSSKAALNLAIHNLALDVADRGIMIGLINPGLVDTRGLLDLKPGDPVPEVFKPLMPLIQSGQMKLMRPAESVEDMIEVIDALSAENSGKFIDHDGAILPW